MALSNRGFQLWIFCVFALLLPWASSFQSSFHVKSPSRTTRHEGEKGTNNIASRSSKTLSPTKILDYRSYGSTNVAAFLSNDNNVQKETNNYNDDAFGFIFLGGYVVTQDPLFAGTFLLISAIAVIATRNGKLPATKTVPAAVAGITLIVSLILPKDQLYQLLPLERPVPSLPVDSSWVEVGFCTVSMIYGFILSSSDQNENTLT